MASDNILGFKRDTTTGALLVQGVADSSNGQLGMYAAPSFASLVAQGLTASQAYLTRFVPSRPMTITNLGFSVSIIAGADDACDVGIYDAALARLGSAGATTGKLNVIGAKTVALTTPVTLSAGTVYYAAFSVGTLGGAAATLTMFQLVSAFAGQLFNAAVPGAECLAKSASHPLPTSLVGAGGAVQAPLLAVRET